MSDQQPLHSRTQPFQRHRNVALGCALAVHGLLLAWPIMESKPSSLERRITVQLQAEKLNRPSEQASLPLPKEPPAHKQTAVQAITPVVTTQAEETKDLIAPPVPAISLDMNSFVEQETKALLDANPQALSDFEKSFAEQTAGSRASLGHFKNQYGDIHVITQVGNRDVCYQQKRQFVDDDFGFNIVMFYDCNKNTNYRKDIQLELP